MITYRMARHTEKKKFKEFAGIALRARLYVSGWQLSQTLLDIRDGDIYTKDTFVLAYDGDTPIGLCVMHHRNSWGCPVSSTFVRKSYRRRGIGTKMIAKALDNKRKKFMYGDGLWEAQAFFDKIPRATPFLWA